MKRVRIGGAYMLPAKVSEVSQALRGLKALFLGCVLRVSIKDEGDLEFCGI